MTEEEIQALQEERDRLAAEVAAKEEAQADLERRHGELKTNFEKLRGGKEEEEEKETTPPAPESTPAVEEAINAFRAETAQNMVQDELVRVGFSAEEQELVKKELGTFAAKPSNLSEVRAQIKRAAKLADLSDPYDFSQAPATVAGAGPAAGAGPSGENHEGETESQRAYRLAFGISDEALAELGPKAEARRRRNQFRN